MCSHFFVGDSFYFHNLNFVSQTVTTTTKPIRSSLLYEYNNSFSHNKNFLCYLLCRQIGMDEESKFSICFSPFLSVLSCVCELYSPLSFVLYCEARRFVQWRYSWFSFSYDMIFLIHIYIQSILNSRTAQLFHEVLCVQEELCSKRMDLWLPCTQHSLRNNKAGSKGCVLENT